MLVVVLVVLVVLGDVIVAVPAPLAVLLPAPAIVAADVDVRVAAPWDPPHPATNGAESTKIAATDRNALMATTGHASGAMESMLEV